MLQFNKFLEMEAKSIEESSLDQDKSKHADEYRFIMNTVLLYGCNPADREQKVLKAYLERLMAQNHINAEIIQMYSPPDFREVDDELTDFEESKIFWNDVWWMRIVGKC